MAAGVTDRVWNMSDLAALIAAQESNAKRGPYKKKAALIFKMRHYRAIDPLDGKGADTRWSGAWAGRAREGRRGPFRRALALLRSHHESSRYPSRTGHPVHPAEPA